MLVANIVNTQKETEKMKYETRLVEYFVTNMRNTNRCYV